MPPGFPGRSVRRHRRHRPCKLISIVSTQQLENTLRNLPRVGTLVKDHAYRQIWRFEHDGRAYYLKFWPTGASFLRRIFHPNPAMREFRRLQWLQKAGIAAPRAVAILVGFGINDQKGNAVVLEAIEPSINLADHAQQSQLAGEPIPHRRHIAQQITEIISQLAKAGLRHNDLHLGNFLLSGEKVYLLDAYAVHKGLPTLSDLHMLAHGVRDYATTTDLLRAWRKLGPDRPLPPANRRSSGLWNTFLRKITGDNKSIGRLSAGNWSGYCFKQYKFPRRWSTASQQTFTPEQWQSAWQQLKMQLDTDDLQILKRSRSGDVLAGTITVGDQELSVVIKRPRRKHWHRFLNEIPRGVRARRAWNKAWELVIRDIPTAWPLLYMQKRVAGYVTDAVIVFERIDGPMLANIDLSALDDLDRVNLFHRSGRLLRKLESSGLYHWDAKSVNFMVQMDVRRGPIPTLVDVDGIRHIRWTRSGIDRLLRSLRDHEQYTIDDSYHLCRGYAPWAQLVQEEVGSADDALLPEPRTASADRDEICTDTPGDAGDAESSVDSVLEDADTHRREDGPKPADANDGNEDRDDPDSNQDRAKTAREPE